MAATRSMVSMTALPRGRLTLAAPRWTVMARAVGAQGILAGIMAGILFQGMALLMSVLPMLDGSRADAGAESGADSGADSRAESGNERAEHAWGALMAAAQGGDGAAYRRLLLAVKTWLGRYYRGRLPPSMIDDAVQEALLAIHEKRHTYDPSRPFVAWLAAIARYKWIDALRALKAKPTDELMESVAADDTEAATTSAWDLERIMVRLKPAQAEVIRLVKLQGFSTEEAAARTGQSVSLVKVNIHRGLKQLSALVQRDASSRPAPETKDTGMGDSDDA
jgi:RNA polymerase sigma factor (sigma-70 family)